MRRALIAPEEANPTPWARLAWWAREQVGLQIDRWRLWGPVAFGGGCATYFALKTEPEAWPLLLVAVVAAGLWLAAHWRGAARWATLPLMLAAVFALGLAVAKLRSDAVAAPIAPAMEQPTVIEGWVVDVDSPGGSGARVVIAPVRVRGLAPEDTPVRLRATVRGALPPPGAPIRLYAILNPPPAPASPGAYDFGRGAYFQRMGGVAFALGQTRPANLDDPPWPLRLTMAVNGFRHELAGRIVHRLGPRTGGVAAAMTTGQEAWLETADVEVMRDSGLAHILSISGLHMAVVGGFVLFVVRLGVAAWPWLALRVPGKKVAATAGLIAVGTYLVVSGSPPPAERAAITASIAFIAILLNRQAVTMHALAVAAFAVLLLQPEAIVTPGFQMSFAATAALVALVESWPPRVSEISAPWPILAVQRTGAWIAAAIAASLVAGLATGPFAMQHFNRTAVYGLLANLATAAMSDFLIMPALAVGALLETIGLGGPFLWLAGQGIGLMLAVGEWTANLPGAVRTVASAPGFTLPIAFLGVLFVCLWRGRLRWLGLPFAAAVMLWPRTTAPDLWIGDAGVNGAWVEEGRAAVMRPVGDFAVDVWSRRWGLQAELRPAEGWTCTRFSCAPTVAGSAPLALWWGKRAPSLEQVSALCMSAPVISVRAVVSDLPAACADRLVLDAIDYRRRGAVELWREDGGWRALWSADVRGQRPWSRYGDAEAPDLSGIGG